MTDLQTQLRASFCTKMEHCLRELLETKVLYQNCSFEPESVKSQLTTQQELLLYPRAVELFVKKPLRFVLHVQSKMLTNHYGALIRVPATVNTSCEICKEGATPHNPIQVFPADECDIADKTYVLSYQCQKCKQGMLVYLVRRQEFKLRLVGRNQIPSVPLPKSFPKKQHKQPDFFKDAEMAYQTGSHLASICLLRIALEQYLRTATNSAGVCTGDNLWDSFKQNLPDDFPYSRAGNLGETYRLLSEIIHDPARLNDSSYPSFRENLDRFFKYLGLFPRKGPLEGQGLS